MSINRSNLAFSFNFVTSTLNLQVAVSSLTRYPISMIGKKATKADIKTLV